MTMERRHRSRRQRQCINPYPCGGLIRPGDYYWAISLPPGTDPFDAKGWLHFAECDSCHEDRARLRLPPDLDNR